MKILNKKNRLLTIAIAGLVLHSASSQALTLEQVVSKALKENPDFVTQTHQQQISEESIAISNSGFLPKLDLKAEAGYNKAPYTVSNKDQVPVTGSVTLTQPIYSGLSTVYDVDRTEAELRQESLKTFSTAERVALAITQAYLEVLRTKETVELSQLNLDTHLRLQKDIKDRFTNGVSNRSDWTQMEGRTALSQSNLITARNDFADAKANYEALTGFAIDEFEKPFLEASFMPEKRALALEVAAKEHPLLKAATETIDAASAQYKVTKSPFMPKVDVVLKSQWNDSDVGNQQVRTDGYSAKMVVEWNLFSGGADDANRKIASSQLNVAKSTRDNTHRQVMQEVRLAWAAYDAASRQKEFNQQHVTFSKETQDLYEQQFKVNRRTLLDVLDIENELFRARTAYIAADYAELSSKYRLLRSTGQMLKALKLTAYLEK